MNKIFYKCCINIVRPVIKFIFPYEVKGKENLKALSKGCILCSNHLSNVDSIFLAISYKEPIFFMAKAELFKNKILKFILNALGVFPIKRGKADKEALNYALNIPLSGNTLGIFIEGTRSKTGEFLRPKSGVTLLANNTGSNVLPVCITGSSSDNKVRLFKKTTICYGKPVKLEEILIENNNRQELKKSTNLIMENIKKLRSN